MTIKELKQTIEAMRKVHNFNDDAWIHVGDSCIPSGSPVVEVGIVEADVQILMKKVVEEEVKEPWREYKYVV